MYPGDIPVLCKEHAWHTKPHDTGHHCAEVLEPDTMLDIEHILKIYHNNLKSYWVWHLRGVILIWTWSYKKKSLLHMPAGKVQASLSICAQSCQNLRCFLTQSVDQMECSDDYVYEPPHDKTNKMVCAPSEDSDQPGHPPSLIRVFTVRMKKAWFLSYPLSAQRRLWSDWADAQADLSLRWAYSHFVGFVMRWFILSRQVLISLNGCVGWSAPLLFA